MKTLAMILILLSLPACATKSYLVRCFSGDEVVVDSLMNQEPEYSGAWLEYQDSFYGSIRTNASCTVKAVKDGNIAPWDKYSRGNGSASNP